jgi:hypothetical protein
MVVEKGRYVGIDLSKRKKGDGDHHPDREIHDHRAGGCGAGGEDDLV